MVRPAVVAHSAPSSNGALTTGIGRTGGSSVPPKRPSRSSPGTTLPWLNTITPAAPAAAALSAFTEKLQLAALDEGDVAGGEAGEVGRLAAARRRPVAGEVHIHRRDGGGDVALTGEVHREVVDAEDVIRGFGAVCWSVESPKSVRS